MSSLSTIFIIRPTCSLNKPIHLHSIFLTVYYDPGTCGRALYQLMYIVPELLRSATGALTLPSLGVKLGLRWQQKSHSIHIVFKSDDYWVEKRLVMPSVPFDVLGHGFLSHLLQECFVSSSLGAVYPVSFDPLEFKVSHVCRARHWQMNWISQFQESFASCIDNFIHYSYPTTRYRIARPF